MNVCYRWSAQCKSLSKIQKIVHWTTVCWWHHHVCSSQIHMFLGETPICVCVCDIKLKHNFVRHINLHPLFIGAFSGTCKISKTCWNLISSTKCWLVQSTIERLYISSIWPKMSCNVLVQQCRNVYPYKLMVGIPSLYGQVGDGGSYITTLILGVIWQCVKTLYPWWTSK